MKVIKGELTAFLSLTFVILISFVFAVLEISVIHTAGNLYRLAADRAVFSAFGEYHVKLLEQYGIFAVDTGYGAGDPGLDRFLDRVRYYGTAGTEQEITAVQFLTDNSGQPFREQVLEYMEDSFGISIISDLTGQTETWEEQIIQGNEMEERQEEILKEVSQLKSAEQSEEETGGSEGENGAEDPFSCLEQIEKEGILSVVMPEDMKLSGKCIDLQEQASVRQKNTGFGFFPARQGTEDLAERLLYDEYVLKFFSNASDWKNQTEEGGDTAETAENSTLSYEAEYILSGKSSDKENLESVLLKIFLIRMAGNFLYLQTDTEKQGEAALLAGVISTALLSPEAADAIKQLILLAWSAGESVIDLRGLLAGNKVAFIKDSDSWQMSLTDLLTFGAGWSHLEGKDTEGGVSYETYLRILLLFSDQQNITMRTLDRIEDNFRRGSGEADFRADYCITKTELMNQAEIYGGLTYTFPTYFGYE